MEEGSAQNGYEGTGFVVGAGAKWNELRTYKIDGTDYKAPLIATNLHVVKDASEITAEFYGLHKEPLQLKKVLTAPDYDLALLEVQKLIDEYTKHPEVYNQDNVWHEFQVPPVDSQTITNTMALSHLVGCGDHTGQLVTKINSRSVFNTADPKLPEGHFLLTSVRGVSLDNQGQGEHEVCFGAGPVKWRNLMM